MMGSDVSIGLHSPRGEWIQSVEIDRLLGFHSLTESGINRGWD
jgi:hypothetical protein